MQKNQYFLIGGGIALLFLLYFCFDRVDTNPKQNATKETTSPPEAPNALKDITPLNIETYISKEKSKLPNTKNAYIDSITRIAAKQNSAIGYKNVAEFWEQQKNITIAAYYYKKAAYLENTEKSITFAGNLYVALLSKTEDLPTRKWQSLEAIECFETILKQNPNNENAKLALATAYTDGTGETMKGVQQLLSITRADSNNVPANVMLGKLAVQSGQFDKAIARLEKVLSIDKKNTEATYMLAEAYKSKGNIDKAITLFERCKKLVNNPAFTAEIDKYITTFKK